MPVTWPAIVCRQTDKATDYGTCNGELNTGWYFSRLCSAKRVGWRTKLTEWVGCCSVVLPLWVCVCVHGWGVRQAARLRAHSTRPERAREGGATQPVGRAGGRTLAAPFLPCPTPPSPSGTNKVASNQERGHAPRRNPVLHVTAGGPQHRRWLMVVTSSEEKNNSSCQSYKNCKCVVGHQSVTFT